MSIIKTENICKSFGSVDVLKNVSLTVEPGEVVVIIGPSGAGKSTYLRSLNHLEKPTSGKIWIDDKLIEDRVNGHNQVKRRIKRRAAILLDDGVWCFSASTSSRTKQHCKTSARPDEREGRAGKGSQRKGREAFKSGRPRR